jgi:hypothetical protein
MTVGVRQSNNLSSQEDGNTPTTPLPEGIDETHVRLRELDAVQSGLGKSAACAYAALSSQHPRELWLA